MLSLSDNLPKKTYSHYTNTTFSLGPSFQTLQCDNFFSQLISNPWAQKWAYQKSKTRDNSTLLNHVQFYSTYPHLTSDDRNANSSFSNGSEKKI